GRQGADWHATDVRCGADGSAFRVVGPGGIEADATIPLVGPYNVANALGAVGALVEAGGGPADAGGGAGGRPGRARRREAGGPRATAGAAGRWGTPRTSPPRSRPRCGRCGR